MQNTIYLILLVLAVGLSLAACGGSVPSQEAIEAPETGEVPEEYSSLTNPLTGDVQAASGGQSVYNKYCSACHGDQGAGDGVASAGLNPAPKNIAALEDNLEDGYLYWRISDGGLVEPFNSAMPAWRNVLSEEERWQVITYLRQLGD